MTLPAFLIPECRIEANGSTEPTAVDPAAPLLITLGITEVLEQQSLQLVIEGSTNGTEWPTEFALALPEKFYEGVSTVYLDPAKNGITQIRASWKVNRWGRGSKTPVFKLYLFAERL